MSKYFLLILTALACAAEAEPLVNADEIIERANLASYYAGADGRSEVRMIISDAQDRKQRRQFTVLRRDVEEGGDQQFLVVFSQPSDVRNTVFLVDKHIDRRISAGDQRTSFVGAHYFYEDVSGRSPTDDTHELLETTDEFYVLRHEPKAGQSVEFTSYVTWIDRASFLPMKIEYENASGTLYRRVEVLKVEEIGGHPTVVASRVSDLLGKGTTDMQFRYIKYDTGVPEQVFTERSLRNPPREWLQRPTD